VVMNSFAGLIAPGTTCDSLAWEACMGGSNSWG
jgi:hypothetical protein